MKKSQILATLALAFALGLGIVMPAANTYASISSTTAEKDQIQDIYNQIAKLDDEYAKLQTTMNFNSYSALYKLIEGENGGATVQYAYTAIADKISKWQEGWLLDWFNDHMANSDNYINVRISNYNNYLANNAEAIANAKNDDASTTDSTPTRINQLSKVTSISAGYNAVENLREVVDNYVKVLTNNYDNTVPAIQSLKGELVYIQGYLDEADSWTNQVNASAKNIFVSTDGATTYVDLIAAGNYIKNIDKSAYNALVKSDAWKAAVNNTPAVKADATGMQMIGAFDEIVDIARSLAKWNYVGAVVEGKDKTTAIADTSANAPVVNYDVAVKDVAAFKAAIEAFINGKAPVTPTDPDTKPGEEGKDPTAPDTGILADAEGNASTTVAMVAGVATALTAAGAGVVAYRNARRSTRK